MLQVNRLLRTVKRMGRVGSPIHGRSPLVQTKGAAPGGSVSALVICVVGVVNINWTQNS